MLPWLYAPVAVWEAIGPIFPGVTAAWVAAWAMRKRLWAVRDIPAVDVPVADAWAAKGMERSLRIVRGGVRRVATTVKTG